MTVCFSQSEGSKTIKENQNGNKSERARVQFSHSVISNSLRLHGLQHARLPCPSPSSWSLLKLLSIELDSKGVREKTMSVFLQSNLGVTSHHFCCIIIIRSSPHSVQFSSFQLLSRVQLCDLMSRSTPGLLVDHQLPESTQTHVH